GTPYISTCFWPSFFQAEDGTRGRNVTGVQTCALPICGEQRDVRDPVRRLGQQRRRRLCRGYGRDDPALRRHELEPPDQRLDRARSEERRVGKEYGRQGGARSDTSRLTVGVEARAGRVR